ncbi:AAA family ATPase [Sphingobium yanoikuyae]|uniref:AAA family ATPase n=1 Tax=Sphingobium yanoikuyae TaxID=13690 RepID=UPI0002DB752C|nr:AAA family ATPase [Sphingobium yanoikuyae]
MIRITAPRGPQPFSDVILQRARERLRAYYDTEDLTRRQRRGVIDNEWKAIRRPIQNALLEYFNGKCAYCEALVNASSPLEIDKFRPDSSASNLDGKGSLDHYTWLAIEWGNHYASCSACNRSKRSIFPVIGERARPMTPLEEVRALETAMLIDPCFDEPADHLEFLADGTIRPTTERGEVTVKVCNLNRPALVATRRQVYQQTALVLRALGDTAELATNGMDTLEGLNVPARPHLAVVRAAIAAFRANQVPETAPMPPVSVDAPRAAAEIIATDEEAFRLTARPLRRVVIRNFKMLKSLELRFGEPSGNRAPWLMLLGENAAGKSTVLQAIGMALAGASEAGRLTRPSKVLRHGAHDGSIELLFWDNVVPVTLTFERGQASFGGTAEPSAIVLGYGALRFPEARARRNPSLQPDFAKLEPLVRRTANIPHPGRWLADLPQHHFEVAARALNDILSIGQDAVIHRDKHRVSFRLGDAVAPLTDLSAGYQTMFAISVDIMKLLFARWDTLQSAAAIVLIDEIDAHLHPRWKMRIVNSLRAAFPYAQFIASTHDPLVLRGVLNGEVGLMRRDPDLGATINQDLPPLEGMQVDAILTSPYFGLESTLDPDVETALAELYHLRSLPQTPEITARIAELEATAGARHIDLLGRNMREQLVIEASAAFVDEMRQAEDPAARQALKASSVSRLQAMLDVHFASGSTSDQDA